MNWNNVNLTTEANNEILDGYSFETLLLEIHCNLTEINRDTVRAQFEHELKIKIQSARNIFESNLDNIVQHAIEDRNK